MTDPKPQPLDELKLDLTNLYREEHFTDLRVGSIKQLTPVAADGSRDLSRPVVFIGETQLMSLPVQTRIEAENLAAAMEAFPAAIKVAVEAMVEEVKELQRQEMSRIVVPGADATSKIIGPK